MSTIDRLLENIPIPRMVRVRQHFDRPFLEDVESSFLEGLKAQELLSQISEGQKELLHHMSIQDEAIGAPIRTTMETVQIGRTENGLQVHMDCVPVRLMLSSPSFLVMNHDIP